MKTVMYAPIGDGETVGYIVGYLLPFMLLSAHVRIWVRRLIQRDTWYQIHEKLNCRGFDEFRGQG